MLTKKQLKIFSVFQRNLFTELTWKQVKELSKETSSSVIQNAILAFLAEKLITERKIGTSKLYSVNLKNSKVYRYFHIYHLDTLPKVVQLAIQNIEELMDKHTAFYSIVIFGSYAIGEQKKDSDLDIAIIFENEDKRKIIEAVLNSTRSLLTIDGHPINHTDFIEMLQVREENLGKQIARKHLAVHNPSIFYSLIQKSRSLDILGQK